MNGIILLYLMFWAACLITLGIVGLTGRIFNKHRAQIAKWILLNIYHDDLGGKLK